MAFKFILFFAILSLANAGFVPVAQIYHIIIPSVLKVQAAPVPSRILKTTYEPHPQYKFSYGVQDTISGDNKSHTEERDGDVVRGQYSLIDADGYRRTVHYTADAVNGFNAVVQREPLVATTRIATTPIVKAAYVSDHIS